MNELGKRVAVAVVAVPAVLGLVYLGGWALAVPLAGLSALGARELYRLGAATGVHAFGPLGALGAGLIVLLAAWRPTFVAFAPWALGLLGAVTALSLAGVILLRGAAAKPMSATGLTLLGVMYAGLPLAVIPLLHALPSARGWGGGTDDALTGLLVVMLPVAATWLGDTTAYFTGSAWGRSKMAPTISPKKSWVGFWGGLGGAGGAAGAWYLVAVPRLPGLGIGLAECLAVGVALGVGAVAGDLVESVFKREAGVKDSGTFFPGHGGVLDRLDALTLTLPLGYALLAALGGGP